MGLRVRDRVVKKEGEALHYCCDGGGCFLLQQLLCYSEILLCNICGVTVGFPLCSGVWCD